MRRRHSTPSTCMYTCNLRRLRCLAIDSPGRSEVRYRELVATLMYKGLKGLTGADTLISDFPLIAKAQSIADFIDDLLELTFNSLPSIVFQLFSNQNSAF
jgi:hypothetical protein